MNPMNSMANMNMGGPVGGPMPAAMNNGLIAAPGNGVLKADMEKAHRTVLNTYIYDYFLREGMWDTARAMLNSEHTINVDKDRAARQNGSGPADDPMETDNKDEVDSKRPHDLPAPNLPDGSENCFLFEWFCLFWDMMNGTRNKSGTPTINQYIAHTQQQSRFKQNAQQDLLRQMRPGADGAMPQGFNAGMMRNMPNGMPMNMKPNNLARTAMANNQNNPQAMQQILQQQAAAKQNQMQRDPSDMDGNRRAASPGSTDNAPSPSKRPRLDGNPQFNPQQPGMVSNGRPQQPGMPGQQMANQSVLAQNASHMLLQHGINPANLSADQFQKFQNQPPQTQQKSINAYSQNLQQHQSQQMPNKQMQNPGGPQGHGSPMMTQAPNSAEISTYYNAGEMGAPGGMRPGPGNAQGGGSNHALQDYQMQLMLLEQQNKKRLMMARQEQDSMGGGMPRADGPGGPGGPPGPNGQAFPDASPQGGVRPGASPNPSEQMKRGTPGMTPQNMPSPVPEGMDPTMAPQFFKAGVNGMEGANMPGVPMNGNMRPPNGPPGQPFNGQMNPQMMGRGQGPQMGWAGGPNGMVPGPQGQVQGTPQQRSMPPPSAPGPNNANGRTQPSSPTQSAAAPPTPQQSNKAAPKKKDTKNAKSKGAGKKGAATTGATPASEAAQEPEATPATPITPVNPPGTFAKNGAGAPPMPNVQTTAAPAAAAAVAPPPDPAQGGFGMDNNISMGDFGNMDFAPLTSGDVLEAFDFDSFLHDGDGDGGGFDFNQPFLEGEIGAE